MSYPVSITSFSLTMSRGGWPLYLNFCLGLAVELVSQCTGQGSV